MGHEEHFQETETIKFNLSDGSEFGYRPMTAGEENDYLSEYIVEETYTHPTTGKQMVRRVEDISKLNKVKTYNLIEAPYDGWDKKTKQERWAMLQSLKPHIFSEIITHIKNIDAGVSTEKKNLSQPSSKPQVTTDSKSKE